MKTYSVPSISSVDSSKLHFFKNQATCDPNTVLSGQGLGIDLLPGNCGTISFAAIFCLDGFDNIADQLNGLVVNGSLGAQVELSNCVAVPFGCPSGSGYRCDFAEAPLVNQCVLSIECPDGTLIDSCPNQTCQIISIPTDSV